MYFLNKQQYPLQIFLVICILSFSITIAKSEVKLPQVFTSNMVLQRDLPIKVWGWADKREKITIVFQKDTIHIKADKKGNWTAELNALSAGGPYEMMISGTNEIKLSNILIGDVWVCSGQSNMEWPLHATNNAEEEIAGAVHPRIRLFTVQKNISTKPLSDCSPPASRLLIDD